ncbi:hypothetical protein OPV22_002620 [Ensete ventricosum]|uniref:Transcription factor CBF/NF-Y/archaeal histone domain-containing protein n=1 Tax=Ensete ventricosum TaxID=4639 RepID=A0AAV8RYI5_ENSVE|nr:hypothetical protein OPV22_002620 [Ensete ventricosum]
MAIKRNSGRSKSGEMKEAEGQRSRGKGVGTSMKKQQLQRKPKEGEKKKNRKEKVAGDDKTKKKNLSRKKMEGVGGDRNQANKKRKSKEGVTKKEEVEEKKKRSRNGDIDFSSSIAADKESGGGGSASCNFPMSRVRRLMRLEGGNTNVTISGISSDAVFLVNKASEMFLEKFVKDSFARGMRRQKKSVTYKDLSSTVHSKKRYEFLSDFVPEKVKAEDALRAKAALVGT